MKTREIRFTEAEIDALADAARRRVQALNKSIAADSGTYHKALDRKISDLDALRLAGEALQVAQEQIRRQTIRGVHRSLNMSDANLNISLDPTHPNVIGGSIDQ